MSSFDTLQNKMFFCTCLGSGILLSRFKDDDDKDIMISMWEYRTPPFINWRHRLEHIWKIIRTGYPYTDDIILTPTDAIMLGNKLIEWGQDESWDGRIKDHDG